MLGRVREGGGVGVRMMETKQETLQFPCNTISLYIDNFLQTKSPFQVKTFRFVQASLREREREKERKN